MIHILYKLYSVLPTIVHLRAVKLWEDQGIACGKHCHTRHTARCFLRLPWSHTHDSGSSNTSDVMACHCSKDILESSSPLHHSSTPCPVFLVALFQISPPKILFHILQLDREYCYISKTTLSHLVINTGTHPNNSLQNNFLVPLSVTC